MTSTDRSREGVGLPPPGAGRQGAGVGIEDLAPLGSVMRERLADGRTRWLLGPGGGVVAERLVSLGRAGLGGFVARGEDARGVWVMRATQDRRLTALLAELESERPKIQPGPEREKNLGGQPEPWRRAATLVRDLALCLEAAEAEGLSLEAVSPDTVILGPGGPWLRAQSVVRASVGVDEGEGRAVSAVSVSEWLTPSAARGERDGPADNRYRLGLLLYRMLAGRGPFAGLGLRAAIDQLERGVPPLPDEFAASLPPGLQALLLGILDPDPSRRPSRAGALAEALTGFLGEGLPSEVAGSEDGARASTEGLPVARARAQNSSVKPAPEGRAGPEGRVVRASWPMLALASTLALGIGAGLWLLTVLRDGGRAGEDPAGERAGRVLAGVRPPLDAAHTSPEDCAGCHPRQSAEWRRSVMGHAAKSPLFQGLEILIEEQVGRSDACPGGAGILRAADPRTACTDPATGIVVTGSGGALWCVNCHSPRENLDASLPPWDGLASRSVSRLPLRDLQPESTTEGIDCGFCHQVHGPVTPGAEALGGYEGNPGWLSTATGRRFSSRPEDARGRPGIANSGYDLDPGELLSPAGESAGGDPLRRDSVALARVLAGTSASALDRDPAFWLRGSGAGERRAPRTSAASAELVLGGAHRRPSPEGRAYLASSEFCGACHDVRLFGNDAVSTPRKGEHFRRLRNAYSEWVDWAALERAAGREPADCQDCHMSSYPGVCVAGDPRPPVPGETDLSALRRGCPPGTHFESRAPGERPSLRVAAGSGARESVSTHYFSGVDIPLTPAFDSRYIDQPELDAAGIPLGGDPRRDLLLGRAFRFELDEAARVVGRRLELPIEIENTGAGHKIPAGFSQEREFWVHLRVTDAQGRLVYEVGRVERGDEDLRDKLFVSVNLDDRIRNAAGQPLGMFGADIVDGPDLPRWEALDGDPLDKLGTPAPTRFRGRGLINLQNGFLRCVQCIGFVDAEGRCRASDGAQAAHRAGRFEDAALDPDTGACLSNLRPDEALFETYFPVGSLDATRGVLKGPDAIIDHRSAPPGVPLRWTYELDLSPDLEGPLTVEARLLFRAFPPFLVRAFAQYEALQDARGLRPSGALVTLEMLDKLEVVEIATLTRVIDGPT